MALRDTLFVVTQPLDVATVYLAILIGYLAAWWAIQRLARRPFPRLFYAATASLALGLLLAFAPTAMLLTGIMWPSLVAILQAASVGAFIVGAVLLLTAALLVWMLFAALIDRL